VIGCCSEAASCAEPTCAVDQPLAEMQAFSELTGGGLGGLWVWYTRPGMSRRGSNSICSRLGSATVGPAQGVE
jgi:hypothetical protein